MKWIGEHIWNFVSKFRNDVYLRDNTSGTSDPDKFLALDSNDKIIHRTGAQVALDIVDTLIKVLPHHFMSNEDGGANKSAQFDDTGIIGVRTTHDDAELYAFVTIPRGMSATEVIVYGNDTALVVNVYESDINAGVLTQKDGGSCVVGTECELESAITADATNYVVIKVTTTSAATDIVYGGSITITPST